jgi:prepilin-type N-terminal cleavage/methylation domain-containing protein
MLRRRSPAPAGFTLVELLVVVTIIVLLLALLLPAIHKIRIVGQEVEARNEMSQLTTAVTTFKNEWGAVPPTLFRLPTRPGGNVGPNAVLENASYEFLKLQYGRWNPTLNAGGDIVWDPSMTPYAGQTLQGNQCMVFFLGGPSLNGWAHDSPRDPGAAVSKFVFLEIKDAKLQPGAQFGYPSNARVYMDPFGAPYLYWGSNKVGGKYTGQPALATLNPDLTPTATGTVNAYVETGSKFANENMCQIISAGPDNRFGSGGTNWTTTNAEYIGANAGADDIANFNGKTRLGIRE